MLDGYTDSTLLGRLIQFPVLDSFEFTQCTRLFTAGRSFMEKVVVEVMLYVHRNRRLIKDGSPGRPPRLSHS